MSAVVVLVVISSVPCYEIGWQECLQSELLLRQVGCTTLTQWTSCHCCDAGRLASGMAVTGTTCMKVSMGCEAEPLTQVGAFHNSQTQLLSVPAFSWYSWAVYTSTLATG